MCHCWTVSLSFWILASHTSKWLFYKVYNTTWLHNYGYHCHLHIVLHIVIILLKHIDVMSTFEYNYYWAKISVIHNCAILYHWCYVEVYLFAVHVPALLAVAAVWHALYIYSVLRLNTTVTYKCPVQTALLDPRRVNIRPLTVHGPQNALHKYLLHVSERPKSATSNYNQKTPRPVSFQCCWKV